MKKKIIIKQYHKQMENLPIFVKKIMLSLACHNHLDFRDYDKNRQNSRLFSLVSNNGWQIDTAIQQICGDLIEQEQFVFLFNSVSQNRNAEGADDIDELVDDLFNYIVSFVGLNTIHTMHPDVNDVFRDEMVNLLFHKDL